MKAILILIVILVLLPDLFKKYSFSQIADVMIEAINPAAIKKDIDKYKMNDAFRITFNVSVKADSETKLMFRVRYRYF